MRSTFDIPTRGKSVPSAPDWFHEIKYDGYRLIVQREGARVRLITRNGHDWSHRFPWIVESALKNRQKHFVIDGEAVVLGVDGVSDFNALHSRQHDDEVQLYAFDILALDGEDLRHPAAVHAQDQPRAPARTKAGRHLRGAVRAGRNRSRPVHGRARRGGVLALRVRFFFGTPTAPTPHSLGQFFEALNLNPHHRAGGPRAALRRINFFDRRRKGLISYARHIRTRPLTDKA